MLRFVTPYLGLEALVVVLAVAATFLGRRRRLRRRDARSLAGFVETGEVFIDPTTGIKQRVWFNPTTGERRYVTVDR